MDFLNDTMHPSIGMWAHTLVPDTYEKLLNRGWRRSGKYLYKPTNDVTCCPMYTINCHALEFKLSKSQKKVLKRFNVFLKNGALNTSEEQKFAYHGNLVILYR